jgi:hypothetical protein
VRRAPVTGVASPERRRLGRCGPTPTEELLVRAALLPTELALDAWRRWCETESPRATDWRSRQILPYVAHHLGDAIGPDAGEVARLQRRRNWADNRLDLAVLAEAIDALRDVAPDPVVVKGAALVDEVYPPGLRPMGDADLVVGPDAYEAAIEHLLGAGWQPIDRVSDRHVSRAAALASPTGRSVDLHRWAAFPRGTRRPDLGLVARAVPSPRFPGARVLAPADALVLAVVHGPDVTAASSIRWPIDVARLAAHHADEPRFWDDVAASARELGAGRLVGTALDWCRSDLGLGVDAGWCADLRADRQGGWVGVEWAVRRRGLPVVGRVRTYVDVSRALGRRPHPIDYARTRWSLLHESGGISRFLARRVHRASTTVREFARR